MVEIKHAKCGWHDHHLEKYKTHSKTMWTPILSCFKTYNTKVTKLIIQSLQEYMS